MGEGVWWVRGWVWERERGGNWTSAFGVCGEDAGGNRDSYKICWFLCYVHTTLIKKSRGKVTSQESYFIIRIYELWGSSWNRHAGRCSCL